MSWIKQLDKQFFIFGLTNKYTELQAPRENLYIEKKLNNACISNKMIALVFSTNEPNSLLWN